MQQIVIKRCVHFVPKQLIYGINYKTSQALQGRHLLHKIDHDVDYCRSTVSFKLAAINTANVKTHDVGVCEGGGGVRGRLGGLSVCWEGNLRGMFYIYHILRKVLSHSSGAV